MIDVIRSIYNFAQPPKPKKIPKMTKVTLLSRERQELMLKALKNKAMYVKDIAKITGKTVQVTRLDVHSLIARGKLINLAIGKAPYYVKAV